MRQMRKDEDGSYLIHGEKVEKGLILEYGRAKCPLWICHFSENKRVRISLPCYFSKEQGSGEVKHRQR